MNPGTTNLLSYWSLEEASGTRVDAHGSNDLTENGTGGVGQGTGKISNCADFELADTDYLTITDASQTNLDLNSSFSISCWINFESLPASGTGMGIVTKDNVTTACAYFLSVYNSSGTYYLYNQVNKTTSVIVQNFASYAFSASTWYHLVLVFNISTGNLQCFVNNSSAASNTNASVNAIQNNSLNFSIGAHNTGTRSFDGLIDEVAIFNDVLTSGASSEIEWLYNSGNGRSYADLSPAASTFTPKMMCF